MKLAITSLLLVPLASIASAQAQPPAPAPDQELIDMEAAWSKAVVSSDMAALNRIIAPDWHGQNQEGTRVDRAGLYKSMADDKVTAMTNHDVHVQFVGTDLAIVQGMDTETSTHKGKSTSGTYSWTDIFQKRDGHWVAIASQNTPVKPEK
jgi:uncharacterized protein (TIGR02246 family)